MLPFCSFKMVVETIMMPQKLKSRELDVPRVCLQGAVCHQPSSPITAHAICRAIVKWNIFYFSSNGFSLLIN